MGTDQLAHTGLEGTVCCLNGCGVKALKCLILHPCPICSLVVEKVHSPHPFRELRKRCSVAAIGKTAGRVRQVGQFLIWNMQDFIASGVITHKVCPFLEPADFLHTEAILFDTEFMYIPLRHCLPEDIAVGLHAMFQGKGLHGDRLVAENLSRGRAFHGNELHFQTGGVGVCLPEEVKHGGKGCGAIDPNVAACSGECYGGKQSEEAVNMVSVDVRYEYCIQSLERQMHTAHLPLGTLAAVNQKQAPTYIKYLSAWIPSCRGLGRSRAQYIQLKVHYTK